MLVKPISAPPVTPAGTSLSATDRDFLRLVSGPDAGLAVDGPFWRATVGDLVTMDEFAVALAASSMPTKKTPSDPRQVWAFFVEGLTRLGLSEVRLRAHAQRRLNLRLINEADTGGAPAWYRQGVRELWGSDRRFLRCTEMAFFFLVDSRGHA
ncbi:hypothetical protein [Micromonospora humidisoli]|uniref:Uncharacterized protein n=1 Tax=Micromonospora humidisoli TaxID=2807622 RepID=A0ABS2J9C0_9ACTN|nr:hypothetical protein [Micromonospora humidisoli]MBM7082034.1 hypothetical protein [Micromonospora humidisoli]